MTITLSKLNELGVRIFAIARRPEKLHLISVFLKSSSIRNY